MSLFLHGTPELSNDSNDILYPMAQTYIIDTDIVLVSSSGRWVPALGLDSC